MIENNFVEFQLTLSLTLTIQNVAYVLLTLLQYLLCGRIYEASGFDVCLFPLLLHLNWVKAKVRCYPNMAGVGPEFHSNQKHT